MPPQENPGTTLVIGALGQIGSELVTALKAQHGKAQVVAADLRSPEWYDGLFLTLDVLDREALREVVRTHQVHTVYNLAAILSAKGEQDPVRAWQINMDGLLNTLEVAREFGLKVFWPSSIAVFGPSSPKHDTPQLTAMEPTTVYGISKLAGERWCEYYHRRYGVDVRSLRYPGLISYQAHPGGGTTDYAVAIFYEAVETGAYTCYLKADTRLPMMYMPDAIAATLRLMDAPAETLQVRSSYNVGAISFTPSELASAIQAHLPEFSIVYEPDFRQAIADSWPASIGDEAARSDWGWQPSFGLEEMTSDMIMHIRAAKQPA
jgi:nucleoside-diphosphate-sugar epimerase